MPSRDGNQRRDNTIKWFKHDGDALHDPKIEKLVMKYGAEGYGLYFACVEIIAGDFGPDNYTFELEHDAEILAYKFKIDTLKVEEIMKYCVSLGLFEINGNNRITCLKLAKRLDNATVQNPDIRAALNNFKLLKAPDKLLKETSTRLDIDKIRREEDKEKNSMSGKPDDTHVSDAKKLEAETVKQVIEYLNHRAGTHFKPGTKAHASHIKARFREGHELDDFKRAIVWCVAEWREKPEMEIYIRPDTIFSTKMSGYIENYYRKKRVLADE